MVNNNKETVKKIIQELKEIEKDKDVIINFIPNQIEDEFYSIGFDKEYVVLKNTIEIVSKRCIEKEKIYEWNSSWTY